MKPKFSIITVCYNSSKTIQKTIESVLGQTYGDFEYIIVDGKSTDDTADIARKYIDAFNGRLTVISEKDNGIYNAMNKGIKMASGEFIGMINANDYYESTALENINNKITEDKYQILYGYMKNYRQGKLNSIVFYPHENLDAKMINHPTCFVSKAVYEDFGGFDESYTSSGDYAFMLRIFHKHKDVKFIPVYKVIANYDLDGISSTLIGGRETLKLKKEYGLISNKFFAYQMVKSKIHSLILGKGNK